MSRYGSSPLTRGKLTLHALDVAILGLIPAHAGKTRDRVRRQWTLEAHPRSRGENTFVLAGDILATGSSPLTRGKHDLRRRDQDRTGLIPAHAGKTRLRACGNGGPRAHPRSRGENVALSGVIAKAEGSSPLTRGKHFLTCAFIAQIDQILESLELCAFSESYSSQDVYATDAPRDRVRSIGLAPRSSRGAS